MGNSRERAFTIVEVVVAALIITVVVVGMISYIASSGRSQQRGSVRQQMVSHHDQILQTVRSERRWLDECLQQKLGCNDISSGATPVDVTPLVTVPASKTDGPKLLHAVKVQAIDSRADNDPGTNADRDGLVPDFYRIDISVQLDPSEVKEYGNVPAFSSVSTVDANALGRANGTLVVDVCEVVNQIDERIAISGCRADGGNPEVTPMRPQPECGGGDQKLSQANFEPANEPWPVFRFGCNNALEDATALAPRFGGMWVRSAPDVGFYIEAENGKRYYRDYAVMKSGSPSTYVFGGIPSGPYHVVVTEPGKHREVWDERMVPSGTQVSVQANQEARALIVVRPIQGLGEYRVTFGRTTYHYKMEKEITTKTVSNSVSIGSSSVSLTTLYTYEWLIPSEENGGRPAQKEWWGPAWNGAVGMVSKPFDRQRYKDRRIGQHFESAQWAATNDRKANGTIWITGLGTGLHSLPHEVPLGDDVKNKQKQFEYLGDLGERWYRCPPSGPNNASGAGCHEVEAGERFAWLYSGSHVNKDSGDLGEADSSVFYHSTDGECYVRAFNGVPSDVWKWGNERVLQRGGDRGTRCDYDLHLRNGDKVEGFFPTKKNGKGGKRYLIGMSVSFSCSGCPGGTGGGGSTSSSTSVSGNVFGRGPAPSPPSPNPPPPMSIPKDDGSGTVTVNAG